MKKIEIYQENIDPIVLFDKDYSDLLSYTNELSKILKSKEISILETTSGNIIIKPSKISSIIVSLFQDEKKEPEKEITKENIDVITDGE